MKNLSARRAVVGLSLAALAGIGLVGVPTPAHAAVEEAAIGGQHYLSGSGPGCATGGDGSTSQVTDPWTDDNVPVTKSMSSTGTVASSEDDVVDIAASSNTTIRATPLGGQATITGTATATASALARQASTTCFGRAQAYAVASGKFTLNQPMWVTLTVTGQGQRQGTGQGTSYAGIGTNLLGGELFWLGTDGLIVSTGNRGSAQASTLLPAGEYGVGLASAAYAEAEGTDEGSASYTGNVTIDFRAPGSASAPTGKGASKVQFGERDCASGNVAVNLSKKTVKKAKRVAIRVNGAQGQVLKGKSLKGKHPKAKTIAVPTSVTGVTKVKVKVTLENGRRMQATRSYLPCK